MTGHVRTCYPHPKNRRCEDGFSRTKQSHRVRESPSLSPSTQPPLILSLQRKPVPRLRVLAFPRRSVGTSRNAINYQARQPPPMLSFLRLRYNTHLYKVLTELPDSIPERLICEASEKKSGQTRKSDRFFVYRQLLKLTIICFQLSSD